MAAAAVLAAVAVVDLAAEDLAAVDLVAVGSAVVGSAAVTSDSLAAASQALAVSDRRVVALAGCRWVMALLPDKFRNLVASATLTAPVDKFRSQPTTTANTGRMKSHGEKDLKHGRS